MTYSKSMGRKVRGKKTLRKNKSGKRRGNKKAKRTYRRRKARGGRDIDLSLMRFKRAAYTVVNEEGNNDPNIKKTIDEIRGAHSYESVSDILNKNHYTVPIIEQ